jgi:hypothetical protein
VIISLTDEVAERFLIRLSYESSYSILSSAELDKRDSREDALEVVSPAILGFNENLHVNFNPNLKLMDLSPYVDLKDDF